MPISSGGANMKKAVKKREKVYPWLVICLTFCLVMPATVHSASFLKIQGVEGESTDKDHDRWIDVLSYSSGIVASSMATGTQGRAGMGNISITKVIDKATPELQIKAVSGEHIPEVQLEVATPDGRGSIIYTMKDVAISSISILGKPETPGSLETVNFSYGAIIWKTSLSATGSDDWR
jgi:type VI secretion system secreted protein Hcp